MHDASKRKGDHPQIVSCIRFFALLLTRNLVKYLLLFAQICTYCT